MSDEHIPDAGNDRSDAEPQLDPATEQALREALHQRAALADGAPIPDLDRLAAGSTGVRRFGIGPALAVAASVVLVIGAVAIVASRRADEPEVRAASPAEVLDALRSEAGDRSFAFEVDRRSEQSSSGDACSASTARRGRVDPRSGLVALELDGGELIADHDGNGSITADLLPASWPIDGSVLTFTAEEVTRAGFALGADSPFGGLGAPWSPSSSDMAERFAQLRETASSVEVVGPEEVRGVETTHVVVALDGTQVAELRAEANGQAIEAMIEAGMLDPEERDRLTGTGMASPLEGIVADDDQRVEAWIDGEGLIRRLVTTTTMRSSTTAPGSVPPSSSSTTSTTTVEAFDYDQVELRLPDPGGESTALGSLPAEVLRPLDHPESPCGEAPVESMRDCTAAAFDEATEGRTVAQFVPTIPTTFEALITPNAWFDGCPMGMEPMPIPTLEQFDQVLRLARIDEADIQLLLDATAAVPSLAGTPPNVLVYQAVTACQAVRSGNTERFLGTYDPRMFVGGISKDAYQDLLALLADPSFPFCA